MQNRQQTARILGASGLLPFVALPVCVALGGPGWLIDLLRAYVLLILAFLCGATWAECLDRPADGPMPLVITNFVVLASLLALLLPLAWGFAWLAMLFVVQASTEWRWTRSGQPAWYRRLRALLGTTVILLLAATAVIGARGG